MNDIETILHQYFKVYVLKKNLKDSFDLVAKVEPGQLMMGYVTYSVNYSNSSGVYIVTHHAAYNPDYVVATRGESSKFNPALYMVVSLEPDLITLLINGKIVKLNMYLRSSNPGRATLFIVKK